MKRVRPLCACQVTIAGYTAGQRAKGVPHGAVISGIAIFIGSSITMALIVLLRVFPSTPQYIIPMTGMMVGVTMTSTGVVLKRLRESIRQQLQVVEAGLALGATPRQAISRQIQRSLAIALAPILDTAKTVGIIALPGTMTGLIMGGATPFEATQMQVKAQRLLRCKDISRGHGRGTCWVIMFLVMVSGADCGDVRFLGRKHFQYPRWRLPRVALLLHTHRPNQNGSI